jgi:hypothetical protein
MNLSHVSALFLIITIPLACGGESTDDGPSNTAGSSGSGNAAGTSGSESGGSAGAGGANEAGSGGDSGSGGQGAMAGTAGSAGSAGSGGSAGSAGSGGAMDHAASCVESGGTVTTMFCCGDGGDDGIFPDTCNTGACGCSPQNSTEIAACDCPGDLCFRPDSGKCETEMGGI